MNQLPELTEDDLDSFDDMLDRVLDTQPQHIHNLLEEVPLIVEDCPSSPPTLH